jgi:hypothetical protein
MTYYRNLMLMIGAGVHQRQVDRPGRFRAAGLIACPVVILSPALPRCSSPRIGRPSGRILLRLQGLQRVAGLTGSGIRGRAQRCVEGAGIAREGLQAGPVSIWPPVIEEAGAGGIKYPPLTLSRIPAPPKKNPKNGYPREVR